MTKLNMITLAAMPGMLRFSDETPGATGTSEYIAHADGPDGAFDSEPIEASSADEAREIAQSTLDAEIGDGEKVTGVRELSGDEVAALGNDEDDSDDEDLDLD